MAYLLMVYLYQVYDIPVEYLSVDGPSADDLSNVWKSCDIISSLGVVLQAQKLSQSARTQPIQPLSPS